MRRYVDIKSSMIRIYKNHISIEPITATPKGRLYAFSCENAILYTFLVLTRILCIQPTKKENGVVSDM